MQLVPTPNPSPLAVVGQLAKRAGRGGVTEAVLLERAKWMRQNPTEAERRLWSILRAKRLSGFKFRRQQVLGWYIADFVNLEQRLVVEADGSQHADSAEDAQRDGWFRSQGFAILRFWNNDILARSETSLMRSGSHYRAQRPLSLPLRGCPSPARGEGICTSESYV
jgi:very-short-patch-repair endonuclease